jgi:FixJ family two-component response regulator
VARAWKNTPDASPADIAKRLKLSPATVKRHRPAGVDKVNGREPEFAAERS